LFSPPGVSHRAPTLSHFRHFIKEALILELPALVLQHEKLDVDRQLAIIRQEGLFRVKTQVLGFRA
jgi:hypothetical protein